MKKYKVLFCDMDGTLIETASGETFPKGIWDMKFKFDVLDAIKNLNPKVIFIVTNQGGIEKGLFPESFIYVKCQYVNDSIIDYCGIDTCFKYCGSNDRSNPMRKPNTGMLEGLFNKYKSYSIGNIVFSVIFNLQSYDAGFREFGINFLETFAIYSILTFFLAVINYRDLEKKVKELNKD